MLSTTRDRSSPAGKSSVAIVASITCLACLFFLIAATIVLALIPIYISTAQVSYNPNLSTSKQAELVLNIDDTSTDRTVRRRAIQNETALNYASVESDGRLQLKSKILKQMPDYVEEITISSASIIPVSSRRKRSLLKRASSTKIALRVLFYVKFAAKCLTKCQQKNAAALKSIFYNIPYGNFGLPELFITLLDGSRKRIIFVLGSARSVSDIIPGTNVAEASFISTITPSSAVTATTAATSAVTATTAATNAVTTTTTAPSAVTSDLSG